MAGSARDRIVVSGVIEMARSLDLGVVAEGVETEEQLVVLARAGCTTYQGYLCSRPLAADELADFVTNRSEEHTSELQSLMRISYAVFCLKKTKTQIAKRHYYYTQLNT